MNRWREFLRSLPARIMGSHVELAAEQPTYLSTRAVMHSDSRLEGRIIAAARTVAKAERKTPESEFLQKLRAAAQANLIEDQPDYGEPKPIDFDDLPA